MAIDVVLYLPAVSRSSHHNPRILRLRFLLPATALLLLALALFAIADNAYNRGITYAPAPPPIAWADVPPLGVNAYNIQYEPDRADVTRTLQLARDLGAHFVRIQMPWEDIEIHGRGDFEDRRNPQDVHSAWDKYDFIVAEAGRLGLDLIARLDRPPLWARQQASATEAFSEGLKLDGNSTGPPDDLADYAGFVRAVVARYRGRVRFFQIWNEPNLKNEWSWRTPAPAEFVDLLRAGYTAAKAANPDAAILFPSLSPTDGLDKRAPMTELEYLDQVYALGGGQYFDIMSAQAYGLGQPPEEHRYIRPGKRPNRPIDTRIDVSRVVLLREVMERNHDGGKAIWISEFGYVVDSPAIAPERRNNWGPPVSEQQRAAYTVGQLERARREWPWIGVMNVWFLRWGGYQPPDPRDPTAHFAIVGRDFAPLPTYDALRSFTASGPIAGVGAHAWSHPAVAARGAGEWVLRFEGTSLALGRLPGPLEVAIDGGALVPFNPDVEGGAVTV
ncbi:MAG TPA: polymerase, partial [Roseiflexaceae bacterium]